MTGTFTLSGIGPRGERYLQDVLVPEEQRGQGLGRKLVEQILYNIDADVVLHCRPTKIDFWHKFGFRIDTSNDPYYDRYSEDAADVQRKIDNGCVLMRRAKAAKERNNTHV